MSPDLCLGSAQFGLDYGVTNDYGKTDEKEVYKILKYAKYNNIELIDTAQGYGIAESIIGENLPKNSNFKIISKFQPFDINQPFEKNLKTWEKKLKQSLERLAVSELHGFLLHDTQYLKACNSSALEDWLLSLKERNLVRKIGLSIYENKDLEGIPVDNFDIIQLPLSIYDQRLLTDGTIADLQNAGKIIYSRSSFLQGLTLENSYRWPAFISNQFKAHHASLEQDLNYQGISLIEASLVFLFQCKNINAVLIGVTSKMQLESICNTWRNAENILKNFKIDMSKIAWHNSKELDPRNWPNKSN